MHSDVINDYISKDVEVTTNNKTFTGNLKLHDSKREIIILEPKQDKYSSRRYGEVVIRQHDVVSVREILPRIEEDMDDDEEIGMKKYDDSDYLSEADDGDSSYWKSVKKLSQDITNYKNPSGI